MPAAEVAAHQRARVHAAMIEIVGQRGYDAVTVRQVARTAGVSTRAFYVHFEGKEECFLRTQELVAQRVAARVIASQAGQQDWHARLRLAFEAFVREVENKPRAVRLALVEAFSAGPAALEQVRRSEKVFETMLRESFASAPEAIEMPPSLVKGIVAGISCVVRSHLLEDRQRELPRLVDEMLDWALSFHSEVTPRLTELDPRSPGPAFDRHILEKASWANGSSQEDDRELILIAAAKLAAAEGVSRLTVPRIRAAAGVPRRSFDAHFAGVEDCLLAALEFRASRALEDAATQATGDSWAGGVHRAISTLCFQIANDQALAKLAFVEIFAVGPSAISRREALMVAIAEHFRHSARDDLPGPSQLAAEASAGAVWGIVHRYVACGRADQLPRIAPTLSFLALAPAIGAAPAMDAIRKGHGVA